MSGWTARGQPSSPCRLLAIVTCLLLVPAPAAHAQTCVGSAGFATHRARVLAAIDRNGEGTTALGGIVTGTRMTFGGAGAGIRLHDRLSETSLQLLGSAGLELNPFAGRYHMCPVAAVLIGVGPRSIGGSDFDASSQSVSLGISAGVPVVETRRVGIVVTSGTALEWARLALRGGAEDQVRTDTRALVSLGAGVMLGDRLSFTPRVTLPLATSDDALRFHLSIGFGLLRRSGDP